MSRDNPNNSSVIQLLIDLEKFGFDTASLKHQIEKDPHRLREVEDYFESHMYPDKALTWTRLTRYESFRALLELSDAALRLSILMIQIAAQSGLVSLSTRAISTQLHMSNRDVQKAISELISHAIIAIVRPAQGRKAAVWMINPDLATCGKPIRETAAFKELVKAHMETDKHQCSSPIALLSDLQDIHSNVNIAIITDKLADGSVIKYSTLSTTADKEDTKKLPDSQPDSSFDPDIPDDVDDPDLPFN